MGSNVIYSRANKSDINKIPVVDGQLVYIKDTHELFLDVGNSRTSASSILFVDTLQERNSIQSPITDKLYYVIETGMLYRYNNGWVAIKSSATDVAYDNTNSGLTATNIQAAIDELNTKISQINTTPNA